MEIFIISIRKQIEKGEEFKFNLVVKYKFLFLIFVENKSLYINILPIELKVNNYWEKIMVPLLYTFFSLPGPYQISWMDVKISYNNLPNNALHSKGNKTVSKGSVT